MPIRVVRFQHQSHSFDLGSDQRVLLFDPRMERGIDRRIGDRFRRLDIGARNADLVVVRGSSPTMVGELSREEMFRALVGETPTLVLAPEGEGGKPILHQVEWAAAPREQPTPELLREAELHCAIQAAGASYQQLGTHYLLPNGRFHAESFVRLADALQDYIDLVRLSDWLAYRVDDRTALVADNGSLLGLLTTIALRVQHRLDRPPPIATLNEYPVGPTAVADAVDRFRGQGWERLLFCISVNASGRLADEVAGLDSVEAETVVLCETRVEPSEPLERFVHYPIRHWVVGPDGSCAQCAERHLVSVDPRTYEIRPQLRLRPQGPDTVHAVENKDFWEAVERTDAVQLHYEAATAAGSPSPSRHLAVWLDAARLLNDESFRAICIERLRAITEVDLVLIPYHPATAALRALVRDALPDLAEERVRSCGLGGIAKIADDCLHELRHVLLVDDTAVSGSTLVRMHQEVRDAGERAIPRVSAFVVLNRPSALEDYDHLRRRFTHVVEGNLEPGFHEGHRLLLPNNCSWCREREFLTDRLDGLEGEARRAAATRRERLVGDLAPPLLWGGGEKLRATFGSLFGDLSPTAAFAAVSAVAQHMHCRLDADRRDETIKIVDLPLLLQAFFDPIIVAGMLRTLPVRDLRDPANDPALARTLRENVRHYPPATIAELAFAVTEGKLPPKPVRELLDQHTGEWVEALVAVLAGY